MSSPKALIVEDDEIQAKILQIVLTRLGIEVVLVKTAKEFVGKIKTLKPDFCLVDLNVESLGVGFSVIQAVRNVLGTEPVLIVASSESDRKAITHALELGANDFIVKPIDRDILIAKISRYVQTEKILDARSPLLPVPNEGISASLTVDMKVQSVDEIGINLRGKHLIAKGTAFYIGGGVLDEITGRNRASLMTVVSTWADQDGTYGSYVEFDKTDGELLSSVRRWISQRKS